MYCRIECTMSGETSMLATSTTELLSAMPRAANMLTHRHRM